MNRDAIAQFVYERVAAMAGLNQDAVDASTTLEGLGIDSSDAVILAMEVEEHLDCEIDPGTLMRFATLGEAIDELSRAGKVHTLT